MGFRYIDVSALRLNRRRGRTANQAGFGLDNILDLPTSIRRISRAFCTFGAREGATGLSNKSVKPATPAIANTTITTDFTESFT